MTPLTRQSQVNVKDNNLRLCLQAVIDKEPISRADIVRFTGISKPTVSKLIDELIEREIVIEIGTGDSSGGRKPILLKFNRTKKLLLAIKMGRATFNISIADLKGTIVESYEQEFIPEMGSIEKLDLIKSKIIELLDDSRISTERILKVIGIAPGIYLGPKNEAKMIWSYEDITEEDIKEKFGPLLQQDIVINHGTMLSLLGEFREGNAQGYKNVLFIDFAYGLGAALMIDGKLYFGPNYSSGEIGYFYSSFEEFRKAKIKPFEMGSLENKISGKALREKGIQAAEKDPESLILALAGGEAHQITAKTVFEAAQNGDPAAYSILEEGFSFFNLALCNVINMFDPEIVVLGGGLSRSGEYLLGFITEQIKHKTLTNPEIKISAFKNNASVIGGIHYLIDHTDFLTEL